MLQKISISVHQNILISIEASTKIRIIIYNQNIQMISEGSCDTEDWSNDAENSALHHRNKLHFKIYLVDNTVIFFTLFSLYF